MATQVEALPPANPLLPAEEHGLVLKKPQEKGEHLMHQGEKANADEGKGGGPDSCSKEEGGGGGNVGDHLRRNGALLKPPSIKQQKEDSNHQEKENLLHQRSGGIIESNRLPGEASSSTGRSWPQGIHRGPSTQVTLNGQSPPGWRAVCVCVLWGWWAYSDTASGSQSFEVGKLHPVFVHVRPPGATSPGTSVSLLAKN
ncbi:hypothetical protein L345_11117, partial [Ophiophagus hannah]